MTLESAINWFNKPLREVEWQMELLAGILEHHPDLDKDDRRLFGVQLQNLRKIYKSKVMIQKQAQQVRIQHLRSVIGRIRKLAGYLQNELADEQIRSEYQVEINRLKLDLERNYPELEIIYNPDNRLLVYALENRVINAMSGPMAERNYTKLKDVLNIRLELFEQITI